MVIKIFLDKDSKNVVINRMDMGIWKFNLNMYVFVLVVLFVELFIVCIEFFFVRVVGKIILGKYFWFDIVNVKEILLYIVNF